MNKKLMMYVAGALALLLGVSGVYLLTPQEEEFDVAAAPPGISIDTGYNATLSGTPFYIVSDQEEDMYDSSLETCDRVGGAAERQQGWYSVVAFEDGMTVSEVVFEQAEFSEGDKALIVYYNSEDKTFEAQPNRIIKDGNGGDLPLLDMDKKLKKGDVVVLNSNVSVEFCNGYKEAADHENVTKGSWNLIAKPDFADVAYRSIWSVDFSGEDLEQYFREGDSGFSPSTLSRNDLYWIYTSKNATTSAGSEMEDEKEQGSESASGSESSNTDETSQNGTNNNGSNQSGNNTQETSQSGTNMNGSSQSEGTTTGGNTSGNFGGAGEKVGIGNQGSIAGNFGIDTRENESAGEGSGSNLTLDPKYMESGIGFAGVDFSKYQIDGLDRVSVGSNISIEDVKDTGNFLIKGTVRGDDGEFLDDYFVDVNYAIEGGRKDLARFQYAQDSGVYAVILESDVAEITFHHPNYVNQTYLYSEIESPSGFNVVLEKEGGTEATYSEPGTLVADMSQLSSNEIVLSSRYDDYDKTVWVVTNVVSGTDCSSFGVEKRKSEEKGCLYKQDPFNKKFRLVSSKIDTTKKFDLVNLGSTRNHFIWHSQADETGLFGASGTAVGTYIFLDEDVKKSDDLSQDNRIVDWSYNPALKSVHFLTSDDFVGEVYEISGRLRIKKTRYSNVCLHKDSGLNKTINISGIIDGGVKGVISMGDGVWVGGTKLTYLKGVDNDDNADFLCIGKGSEISHSLLGDTDYGLSYEKPWFVRDLDLSVADTVVYEPYFKDGQYKYLQNTISTSDLDKTYSYPRIVFQNKKEDLVGLLKSDFYDMGSEKIYMKNDYTPSSDRTVYDIHNGKKLEFDRGDKKLYFVSM